jgi:acetyl-CoA synthetase
VLHEGMSATPDALLAFGNKHLTVYKAPKIIYLTWDFPTTKNGKILRQEISSDIAILRSGTKP